MIKYFKLILLVAFFYFPAGISARDINLDEIYIKKNSSLAKKLAAEKLEVYNKAGAVFVDRNVVFSGWISGDEIIYIKEAGSGNTNYVYKYKPRDRKAVEICRLHGLITIARVSPNGRFLVLKRLIRNAGIIPKGELIIINISSAEVKIQSSAYAFLDFNITDEGNSIIFEKYGGIIEYFFDTEIQSELLLKKKYNEISGNNNPSIAYLSPDRQKILVLNGSGGSYKAKLIYFNKNESSLFKTISSASELFWLNNISFVYRSGYAGNYSVNIYNIKENKKTILLKQSLNTNINYSVHSGKVAFLKEQLICFYNMPGNKVVNTGLEGEDISFAPNDRFVSLFLKKLFIVSSNSLEKKHIELKRSWGLIHQMYIDLLEKKDELENEYSRNYIERKIRVYKELIDYNF
ncbi:MAG: hypothetical protein V1874_04080 [Spirochaetota bacterium]